jgi:putative ABC transport system ATP-binding protein
LLQRLAKEEGRAVAMVTHDPRVLEFGDRILLLEDGRIVREEIVGEPLAAWSVAQSF